MQDWLTVLLSVGGTILLPILLWLVSPKQCKAWIRTMLIRLFNKRISCADLQESIGAILTLNNVDSLTNETYVNSNPYVYFPVVPKACLTIIHLNFINKIKKLLEIGLKVKVLIFDEYYHLVKHQDLGASQKDIKNFVKQLTDRGLPPKCIILESKYLRNKKRGLKVLSHFMALSAHSSIAEVNRLREISSAFTQENDAYIRQEKLFYNQIYANLLNNIGFVLCGSDEVPMWEHYVKTPITYCKTKTQLIILSIDKMTNSFGQETSIWDEGNLCIYKDRKTIRKKIEENLRDRTLLKKECGIFYLLTNLFFCNEGATLTFTHDGNDVVVSNINKLIEILSSYKDNGVSNDSIMDSIISCVYEILHDNKERKK